MNKKYMIVKIFEILYVSESLNSLTTRSCFEVVKKDIKSLKEAKEQISSAVHPSHFIAIAYF
jgi:hypothetical protein